MRLRKKATARARPTRRRCRASRRMPRLRARPTMPRMPRRAKAARSRPAEQKGGENGKAGATAKTGGGGGANVTLSSDQRTKIHKLVINEHNAPARCACRFRYPHRHRYPARQGALRPGAGDHRRDRAGMARLHVLPGRRSDRHRRAGYVAHRRRDRGVARIALKTAPVAASRPPSAFRARECG